MDIINFIHRILEKADASVQKQMAEQENLRAVQLKSDLKNDLRAIFTESRFFENYTSFDYVVCKLMSAPNNWYLVIEVEMPSPVPSNAFTERILHSLREGAKIYHYRRRKEYEKRLENLNYKIHRGYLMPDDYQIAYCQLQSEFAFLCHDLQFTKVEFHQEGTHALAQISLCFS